MKIPEWTQPKEIKRVKITAGTRAKALFMGATVVGIKIREILQKADEIDKKDTLAWFSEPVDVSQITEQEVKEIKDFLNTANLPYTIIDGSIRVMI